MTEPEYRAHPALNWSLLKEARADEGSWKLFAHRRATPREDSAAMAFGRAAHCAVLEPDTFAARYAVAPECDRRTRAGKETWEAFVLDAGGREVLTVADHARVQALARAVRAHPHAAAVLAEGRAETPIVWTDEVTRTQCKGLIDWSPASSVIVDLKTARSLAPRTWQSEAWRYGYAHQLAWYRWGWARAHGIREPESVTVQIVAVESAAPWDVGVFDLDPETLAVAWDEVRALIDGYARCVEAGSWPGRYPEITTLRAPAWALVDADGGDDMTLTISGEE